MAFHDVLLPTNVNAGSGFGPGFNTSVVVLASGAEQRVARWSAPKRRMNLAYTVRKPSDLYNIMVFYVARTGPANTFRIKDWSDYSTSPTGTTHNPGDVVPDDEDFQIGTGDGSETQFQLVKQYVSGAQTATRTIVLPVAGTTVIAVNAVAQTEGADFTVNNTTGLVTFTVAPANTLPVTAGFEFDVVGRFGEEIDFSMAINLGEFDIGDIPDIPIVEVRDELADPEMAWHGGSTNHGNQGANFTVTLAQGRMHRIVPTANIDVFLPSVLFIEAGGPVFAFQNDSGSFTVRLMYDDQTTVIVTMAINTFVELWLVLGAGDLKEWQVK